MLMREDRVIAGILMVLLVITASWSTARSQTSRQLTVSLDTLEQNICGARTFIMPVWVGDVPVSDSLYGVRMVISWDRSTLDLEDFILTGGGTLVGGVSQQPLVIRDRQQGILVIELGTDPNGAPISGSGKPLFFLRGAVIAEDTVTGQNGWIDVVSAKFTANTSYDPLIKWPGLVHVYRDTSEAYTGRIEVSTSQLDTLTTDTVDVILENVGGRRVREVSFVLAADTSYYVFTDTVENMTLAAESIWKAKEVTVRSDTLRGRFEANTNLLESGVLIRVVLERRSRQAFTQPITITDLQINQGSCLGRLERIDGEISANAIPRDSGTTGVDDSDRLNAADRWVRKVPGGIEIEGIAERVERVAVMDVAGREVASGIAEPIGPSTLFVRISDDLPQGGYFVILHCGNSYEYKQFTIVK